MNTEEFSEEQKLYLQGFMNGANLARANQGLPGLSLTNGTINAQPNVPETKHPLDRWDDIIQHAAEGRFPKGDDVLAFKSFGLFHVAPAQNSYMCRLRFAGGIITAAQMRAVARLAQTYGGNDAHVTTRANLQIREISAANAANVLMALYDAGIVNKGAGADNIRNITGSATAGIDARELIDTRPLARAMHHYIQNHRDMYGLPRKFNISFDGGGAVHTLEDTNDIGFQAVRVGENKSVPAGVYFRLLLGGITGHRDFARDTGILLLPEECIAMAAAIVRVFHDEGDRNDRQKARFKYVLDRMGLDGVLDAAKKHLPFEPLRFPREECEPRPEAVRNAHVGVHPQKQEGFSYIGVALMAGRLEPEQMFALADLADHHGSGELRLTVWQNLLLPDVRNGDLQTVQRKLEDAGLGWKGTDLRANLIACTGNAGCKFALSNTKQSASDIVARLGNRLQLDPPVNIHITGCVHSCAQHYIGDIGLIGAKVEAGDDMADGYHILAGGGYGEAAALGREIFRGIAAPDAPRVVEAMLTAYLEHRDGNESFARWTCRYSPEQIKEMSERQPALAG